MADSTKNIENQNFITSRINMLEEMVAFLLSEYIEHTGKDKALETLTLGMKPTSENGYSEDEALRSLEQMGDEAFEQMHEKAFVVHEKRYPQKGN